MNTLLLRLAAPMQSWGAESMFDNRLTHTEPTRSGVIGMLASAMGMRRDEPLDVFDCLKFGVRIDQIGKLGRDFHMVHSETKNCSWITNRYYLYDAAFLVGLEGESRFLQEIDEALSHPAFPLYLGRRSCPASGRISLGMREKNWGQALTEEPWIASQWYRKSAPRKNLAYLEIVRDAADGETGYSVHDVPVSFNPVRRRYGYRDVVREKVLISAVCKDEYPVGEIKNTEHDPFAILEG